ncbi:MAG: hypothetical protein R3B09_15710 [Nannocystaceae bacterium]
MLVDDVRIQNPCHEDWSAMDGRGARRFCESCERHVHDLSAMSEDEARDLVGEAARSGERICVRYSVQTDGSIRFRTPPPPPPTLLQIRPRPAARRPASLARAGLAAALLAACTPHADDAPACDTSIVAPDERELVGKIAADPPPVEPTIVEAQPRMGEVPPPNFEPPPPPPAFDPVPSGDTFQGALIQPRIGDLEAPSAYEPPPPAAPPSPAFAPPPPPVEHGVKMGKIAIHHE